MGLKSSPVFDIPPSIVTYSIYIYIDFGHPRPGQRGLLIIKSRCGEPHFLCKLMKQPNSFPLPESSSQQPTDDALLWPRFTGTPQVECLFIYLFWINASCVGIAMHLCGASQNDHDHDHDTGSLRCQSMLATLYANRWTQPFNYLGLQRKLFASRCSYQFRCGFHLFLFVCC